MLLSQNGHKCVVKKGLTDAVVVEAGIFGCPSLGSSPVSIAVASSCMAIIRVTICLFSYKHTCGSIRLEFNDSGLFCKYQTIKQYANKRCKSKTYRIVIHVIRSLCCSRRFLICLCFRQIILR